MDHEIIYEKGLRGKVTITFNSGNKYGVTIDWKGDSKPITKVKKGTKDITTSGKPFVINLDQELEFEDKKVKISYFETVDRDGNINILSLNKECKVTGLNAYDQSGKKTLEFKYLTKDKEAYNQIIARKLNQIITNSVAIYVVGIDDNAKPITIEIIDDKVIFAQ